MGALADMLAHGGDAAGHADTGEDHADGDTPEANAEHSKKMAAASIKEMFAAACDGKWDLSAQHLSTAMSHCENSQYNDPEEAKEGESSGEPGHTALLLVPHKG